MQDRIDVSKAARGAGMLEAREIVFAYGRGRDILKGFNMSVKAGERVALVGPSGCGKSTLAQILAGMLRPKSGEVTIDGKPLPKKGFRPVQLIYQHPEKAVNPRLKLGKTLTEASSPDDALLAALGIEKAWMDRYPAELSGGELQRFCIARALAPETRFIIADEVSTMLDVITQAQIWELLCDVVSARGLGLIAVTHSAALAERVSERIITFDDKNSPPIK
ncbi:MAG: ATP-binding cassette domain-containing protein [Oscillospiraceae bacterium]|jgi:peptide/nickel transport system ATP-binding protein|nr:ATP-binding cassette domain-containing protein [Oscillospiraceae bacterium]